MQRDQVRLYAVTDDKWEEEEKMLMQVEAALKGGVTLVQLRKKKRTEKEPLSLAQKMKELCHRYQVPLLINDSVEIAKAVDADGVHLGQSDGSIAEARAVLGVDKIIGASVKTVAQAEKAKKEGADYFGVGAAFATSTKQDASVIPHERYAMIKEVGLPVVAIGGIHAGNLLELSGSGIDGVALISAIFSAPDIEKECHKLRGLVEQVRGENR